MKCKYITIFSKSYEIQRNEFYLLIRENILCIYRRIIILNIEGHCGKIRKFRNMNPMISKREHEAKQENIFQEN